LLHHKHDKKRSQKKEEKDEIVKEKRVEIIEEEKMILIECITYLTQNLSAYVAWVILYFLNLTVIGGSVPGFFASYARALNWGNILKK